MRAGAALIPARSQLRPTVFHLSPPHPALSAACQPPSPAAAHLNAPARPAAVPQPHLSATYQPDEEVEREQNGDEHLAVFVDDGELVAQSGDDRGGPAELQQRSDRASVRAPLSIRRRQTESTIGNERARPIQKAYTS